MEDLVVMMRADSKTDKKTVLLTGATGFIGSHLLKRLLADGFEVIIIKRSFSDTHRIADVLDRVKSYDIDVCRVSEIFDKNSIDFVLNLATHYRKTHSQDDASRFVESNISFPVELLESMVAHSVTLFVNAGTFFEYLLDGSVITESSRIVPYNLYSASKAAFSRILEYYCSKTCVRAADLKLFAPYGTMDNEKLMMFLVRNFIQNKPFDMSPSEQRWNWTHVDDIVDAFMLAMVWLQSSDSTYEVFNIGSEKSNSVKEVISLLEVISGKTGLVSYSKAYPENEIFFVGCDCSKAKNLLGWRAKVSLREGLSGLYSYCEGEPEDER